VAFKQNLPVLAVLVALGAVGGALLFLRPPPEDRLKKAVEAHVATLQNVKGFGILGNVADVQLADGSVLFAEFAEKDGAWRFSKDLGEEFRRTMQDPAVQAAILNRLAQRLAARFNTEARVKEGVGYEFLLLREDDGRLRGNVTVSFAYPNTQKRGKYIETWRYADGAWSNSGVGSLYDFSLPAPPK
jgi:hypothetical protein